MAMHMSEQDEDAASYWRRHPGDAAHAATAEGADEPEPKQPVDKLLTGYARGIVSALLVGAIVAFVLVVKR